jgi:hypothetical protein
VLIILKRDAAPDGLRIGGERSGTQEWSAQEGPRNTEWFWLRGTPVPEAGPERPKDQRTFGPRSRVDRSGSSKEGAVRWNATPELVSQDREAGTKPFTGRDQVDRTPAYPSLGAVGAGSNAGPHFFLGSPAPLLGQACTSCGAALHLLWGRPAPRASASMPPRRFAAFPLGDPVHRAVCCRSPSAHAPARGRERASASPNAHPFGRFNFALAPVA